MIKKFNEYIEESIWSNINKRSEGSMSRKEDDLDLMGFKDFIEYVKSHYTVREEEEGEPNFYDIRADDNFRHIYIPLITCGTGVYNLNVRYKDREEKVDEIYLDSGKYFLIVCKEFIDDLKQNFDVEIDSRHRIITFNDVSNKTVIKIIEMVISKYKDICVLEKITK
jgi:hypothetical protein